MTEPDRKFEEEIRRALYAAGDLIVPAGDGLNKIRQRAAQRPPALGWLLAYAAHLPRQLLRGIRVAASELAATTRGYSSLRPVLASARRWRGQARHALRTPSSWLRPALATAAALLLVLGVMLSIPRLRATVGAQLDSAFGSSSGQGSSGGSGGAGAGVPQSSGATRTRDGTASHMAGMPFLATMPPGSTQCLSQGSGGTTITHQSSGPGYIPPSLGPGPGQTVGAGTSGGAANSAGTVGLNAAPSGGVGPEPSSVTCPASTAPATQATSPPVTTSPPTIAATSPPTVPVTSPTTTPVTSPPTTTTPTTPPTTPTTTPPTTPSTTTTSPQVSTSSANTPAAGAPTETATPGG